MNGGINSLGVSPMMNSCRKRNENIGPFSIEQSPLFLNLDKRSNQADKNNLISMYSILTPPPNKGQLANRNEE